jgi:hypothetical protein
MTILADRSKIAIVTGSSRGLGRSIVLNLARRGLIPFSPTTSGKTKGGPSRQYGGVGRGPDRLQRRCRARQSPSSTSWSRK